MLEWIIETNKKCKLCKVKYTRPKAYIIFFTFLLFPSTEIWSHYYNHCPICCEAIERHNGKTKEEKEKYRNR